MNLINILYKDRNYTYRKLSVTLSKYCLMLLLLLFINLYTKIAAQSTKAMVSYDYDYAGNRVARTVIFVSTSDGVKQNKNVDPQPVKEQLGELEITIYPNPTKGMLQVVISGMKPNDTYNLNLYDLQGKPLFLKAGQSDKTLLDMASYVPGSYILRVQAGSKIKEFKIIKQ
jgi:hypothetical protein